MTAVRATGIGPRFRAGERAAGIDDLTSAEALGGTPPPRGRAGDGETGTSSHTASTRAQSHESHAEAVDQHCRMGIVSTAVANIDRLDRAPCRRDTGGVSSVAYRCANNCCVSRVHLALGAPARKESARRSA